MPKKINNHRNPHKPKIVETPDRIEDRRFYMSKAWRNLRAYHLKIEPLCRQCKADGYLIPGNHVDHVIERKQAPHLELCDDNLQTLCVSCHSKKTFRKE